MVVHFDAHPWFIRDFQPVLLLQTLEDRVHQVVPARLHIGQQCESTPEILAQTLRRSVGPKHLRLTGTCTMENLAPLPRVFHNTTS